MKSMDKKIIKIKNISAGIVVLMLLLAMPSGIWPYGYYMILRWVVAGVAIFISWIAYELNKKRWSWLMAGIAILFNPILPIYFNKSIWVIIDFLVATLFLVLIFKIKSKE